MRSAQIAFDNAKRELERNEELFKQGVVAEAELQQVPHRVRAAPSRSSTTAGSNLQLVKEGATRGQGKTSTLIVTATVDGMVIDVPVKVGFSVIQANNFNPGTTVADDRRHGRHDLRRPGRRGRGREDQGGHEARRSRSARSRRRSSTASSSTSRRKGKDDRRRDPVRDQGRGHAEGRHVTIRANYSANADIVLDEKKQVLAIREALVQYENGKPFVEVETAPQTFVQQGRQARAVRRHQGRGAVAASTKADKIKIPENAGPPRPRAVGPGGGGKPPPKK